MKAAHIKREILGCNQISPETSEKFDNPFTNVKRVYYIKPFREFQQKISLTEK